MQQHVHLGLGADIDAARRFVNDQHTRSERQPAGQHHLLLIAARQVAHLLVGRRHPDVETLAVAFDQIALLLAIDKAETDQLPERRDTEIFAHSEVEEQGLLFAVLRHQADAGGNRVLRAADVEIGAVQRDGAAAFRIGPEDGACKLRAA